jgi:hypothetical protein
MTTTPHAAATMPIKLNWNSVLDAEDSFEAIMSELRTTLIKESVFHCVSESDSLARLTIRPAPAGAGTAPYVTQMAAWEKSLKELNDDANKAMGTLMALFDPECNAHRSLTLWYSENVTAGFVPSRIRRKDYNFRNAWVKFYAEYQPNKQVNLDTILKKWETLTDEGISFAEFMGKYYKLISEMEDIGQPPTEAKRYEMLRTNVKNPNLRNFVVALSLPDERKIPLAQFFEDCNVYLRYNKNEDTGRKRKADEVFGRAVTITKTIRDGAQNATCWRCGQPGHLKFNFKEKLACSSTACSLCRKHIGNDPHDAKSCCDRSHSVFPGAQQPSMKKKIAKSNGSNSSQQSSKKAKQNAKARRPVPHVAEESVTALPKHVVAALAVLNKYQAETQSAARRVTFSEEDSSA